MRALFIQKRSYLFMKVLFNTLLLTCFAFQGSIAQLPADFNDQKLPYDFENPMGMTFDEDGNLYLWLKKGQVFLIDKEGQLNPTPIIDISEEISDWHDHGLSCVALDPFFMLNGRVYLLYTVDLHHYEHFGSATYHPDTSVINEPTFGRLTSLQLDLSTKAVKPETRQVILGESIEDGIPLLNPFHGLGTILIAEDGTLLLSVGNSSTGLDIGNDPEDEMIQKALADGLIESDKDIGSYRSQYLHSYGGKILRIDANNGAGLSSNPFYDATAPRSPKSRIWAYGFRNPWRITTFPNTGSHYPGDGNPGTIVACDVGDSSWEEINLVTKAGQNFGWPIAEGYYWNWAFFQQPVPDNQRAPNPLYKTGGCDKPFFNFRELTQWQNINEALQFNNPCASTVPISDDPHLSVLQFPIVSWSHKLWNSSPTRTEIASNDDKGYITGKSILGTSLITEQDTFSGFSSLAGVFYTHDAFPELYHGKYFNIDHSGWIKVFEFDDNQELVSIKPFHDDVKNIIHLSLNPVDGSLYYLSTTRGLHKITYGGDIPPTPIIQSDKNYGPGPLKVAFDASKSVYTSAPIIEYLWDFGDGNTSNELSPNHEFRSAQNTVQSFTVNLTIQDSIGQSQSTQSIISINNTPPSVQITSIEDGDLYPIDRGALIRLDAEVKDLEHTNQELEYQWKVFFHHNDHFHPEPIIKDPLGYVVLTPIGCELEQYWYRIVLEVIDPGGLKSVDEKRIYPNCNPLSEKIQLQATSQVDHIALKWEAAFSNPITQFEIQRSTDFLHFKQIATMENSEPLSNAFMDQAPQKGNNIYRIKVKYPDQSFYYSNLAVVPFPEPGDLILFPNPVINELNIQLKEALDDVIQIRIFNSVGQLLIQQNWEAKINQSFEGTLPLSSTWNSGTYFYTFKNGPEETTGKFLIQK